MTWGIYDTQDGVWIGNDDGPLTYDEEVDAKAAAMTADAVLGQEPGRCRAREYEPGPKHLRDEKERIMSPEEAIKRLEKGLL